MQDKTIKFAIIGCGRVAGHHARSVVKIPYAKLIACCDLVAERAASFGKELGTFHYINYHEMLQRHPEIDVVCIATPSGMHFEHMRDVILRYNKHVVIEKPMVMTLSEGYEIKKLAEEKKVLIFPVFQNRFNKAIKRVKKSIGEEELGEIVLATIRIRWFRPQRYYDRDPWRGTFSMDGGAMVNQGIHFIDLLRYLAGDMESACSILSTREVDIEVENTAAATLRFKSGATGVIEITTFAYDRDYEASLSIVGTKGLAMVGGIATNKLLIFTPNPADEIAHSEEFPTIYGFGHYDILEGVVDELLGRKPRARVSFDDALETIRVLHALYRSDEEKQWIEINDKCFSARLGVPNEDIARLYRTPLP